MERPVPSRNKVHNTHISADLRALHAALLDIMIVMNHPRGDAAIIREAGIPLDRALFPLLVGIDRYGPVGVVDLADAAGRDHTTVSRQVGRLESLGLVTRQEDEADRRMRRVAVTAKGADAVRKVDAARERMAREVFAAWAPDDVSELARLMRRLADSLKGTLAGAEGGS
jgi:DNA-binding MarR family transcriptional regulator